MQFYTDPSRKQVSTALPDAEVFQVGDNSDCRFWPTDEDWENVAHGFYWWSCFPGCLPDSDPTGPFATEALAIANAQDGAV